MRRKRHFDPECGLEEQWLSMLDLIVSNSEVMDSMGTVGPRSHWRAL